MARIFERDNRFWLDYRDHRGERVRRPASTDRGVAQVMLGEALKSVEMLRSGVILADPRLSAQPIAGHLRDYLRELERRGRDQMYRYTIGKRIEMVADSAGWEDLDDCSAASVQKFLGGLATGAQPRTPKTINGFRADLSAFFNWAVGEGRIAFNPCSRVQKVTDKRGKTRRPLSVQECQDLLNKCRSQRRLVYLFLIYTGLRRAEASALRWGDLRLDGVNPRVDLPASITKSGRSESVPLVGVLAEALIEARKNAGDDEPVFRGIPKMESFRKDLRAAGIEEVDGRGRRVVLHSLRHSLATMLAASHVPMAVAQRIMRHRDIRLTAEVYTDEGMLPLAAGVRELPSLSITTSRPAAKRHVRSA